MSVFVGLKFRRVSPPIHNLDPRLTFFYLLVIFLAAILFCEILPVIALFLLQSPFVLLARVQKQWLRSLRGATFLAAFIFIVNIATKFFAAGYMLTSIDIEFSAA